MTGARILSRRAARSCNQLTTHGFVRTWVGTESQPTWVVVLAVMLFLAPLAAVAQQSPEARLADGSAVRGQFAGLESGNAMLFQGALQQSSVPRENLLSWGGWRDSERGPQIHLIGGDLLRADILRLARGMLTIGDASDFGRVAWEQSELPLENVVAVVFQPPADPAARDRLRKKLQEPPVRDELHLVGGEKIEGTLVALPPSGRFAEADRQRSPETISLAIAGRAEPLLVPAAKVVAWRQAAVRFAPPPPDASAVGFSDGSLVFVVQSQAAKGSLQLELTGGSSLSANLAWGDGAAAGFWKQAIYVEGSPPGAVWVSDLPGLDYKQIPFLSATAPLIRDGSVTGGALRVGDQVYRKGLGMRPAARVVFECGGAYRRLEGAVAVDASAGKLGSVRFRVLAEGENGFAPLFESPVLRGGDPPAPLKLDIFGVRRIALIVDFADQGDAGDHADWLDLRLIK